MRSHGGTHGHPVHLAGMSFKQFNDFVAACRSTSVWALACEKGHVNLYDVVTSLVKPWTRNTGCGIALRMNPKEVLQAEPWMQPRERNGCWKYSQDCWFHANSHTNTKSDRRSNGRNACDDFGILLGHGRVHRGSAVHACKTIWTISTVTFYVVCCL